MDAISVEDIESTETILECFDDLRAQMTAIHESTTGVHTHLKSICRRINDDTTRWLDTPMKPKKHILSWIRRHGVPARPTARQFIAAVFANATEMNLETRMLTFSETDAVLWGRQQISLFEIIEAMPTLFE